MQAKSHTAKRPRIYNHFRVFLHLGVFLHICALAMLPSLIFAQQEQYTPEQREEIESSLHDDSFITPQEYGANLYENPRGIGCVKCHGRDGEENLLASYTHKGKQKHIIAPRINNLTFPAFKIALSKDNGVMPRYNLTDEEINAIYLYITSRNKTFR